MGYQFSNDWPYSNSSFPSMDDHVDPVNNVYFSGLMQCLGDMQYFLGLNPEKGYADVAQKLTLHSHEGGDTGVVLPLTSGAFYPYNDSMANLHIISTDNNEHDCDLASYLPAAATAVIIRLIFNAATAGMMLAIYKKGEAAGTKKYYMRIEDTDQYVCADCIILLDANKEISYQWSGGTDTFDSYPIVVGYFT